METATKIIIKAPLVKNLGILRFNYKRYFDVSPALRVLPKYIKSRTLPDIGLDIIDRGEYSDREIVSLLKIDAQDTYDKKSIKPLYQILLDKFTEDKVTLISTKWGYFCSGRGLLFGDNNLLAIQASQEYIVHDSYKVMIKRNNKYDTYLVPLTSKDRYIKGLYTFLKENLQSYIISVYKFYAIL